MYLTLEEARQYDERIDLSHISTASQIIDKHCGVSFVTSEHTERIDLNTTRRIKHLPVYRLIVVRGLLRSWDMASHFGESWVNINIADVHIDHRGEVFLPSTLFNTSYDEAEITYESGWDKVPENVAKACGILAKQLTEFNSASIPAYRLSSLITPEVADLLAEYLERRSSLV